MLELKYAYKHNLYKSYDNKFKYLFAKNSYLIILDVMTKGKWIRCCVVSRSEGKVLWYKWYIYPKLSNKLYFSVLYILSDLVINKTKAKSIIEIWFRNFKFSISEFIYSCPKLIRTRFNFFKYMRRIYEYKRNNMKHIYSLMGIGDDRFEIRQGWNHFSKNFSFTISKKLDFKFKKLYNNNMSNEEKTLLLNREFFDDFFKLSLSKLEGEPDVVEKKKDFLKHYSALLSVKAVLCALRISFEEFQVWLKDENFNKIYNWLKDNKHEFIEFVILAKSGLFGSKLKKIYDNYDGDLLLKMLKIYVMYENSIRHSGEVEGEDRKSSEILGKQDGYTDISVEEK